MPNANDNDPMDQDAGTTQEGSIEVESEP